MKTGGSAGQPVQYSTLVVMWDGHGMDTNVIIIIIIVDDYILPFPYTISKARR